MSKVLLFMLGCFAGAIIEILVVALMAVNTETEEKKDEKRGL